MQAHTSSTSTLHNAYSSLNHKSISQPPVIGVTSGNASLLDPSSFESLKLVMDASLRVHARHHFFTWTQGLLQNL